LCPEHQLEAGDHGGTALIADLIGDHDRRTGATTLTDIRAAGTAV
jgi:hypothetical protein